MLFSVMEGIWRPNYSEAYSLSVKSYFAISIHLILYTCVRIFEIHCSAVIGKNIEI